MSNLADDILLKQRMRDVSSDVIRAFKDKYGHRDIISAQESQDVAKWYISELSERLERAGLTLREFLLATSNNAGEKS